MQFSKQDILSLLPRVILAALFIASAFLKLNPIEPFELTLVDSHLSTWGMSPFFARLLIGSELFLGAALLLNTRFTDLLIKLTFILLGVFSVYLILLWIFRGGDVNCGCFGNNFAMTPFESLLKNAGLTAIAIWAWKTRPKTSRSVIWANALIFVAGMALPFVLNPVLGFKADDEDTSYPYDLPVEYFTEEVKTQLEFNPSEGEYILTFFSLTCPHCKYGAQKLAVAQRKFELPQIHVFFIGEEQMVEGFFAETNSEFPFTLFNDNDFFKFNDGVLPTYLYVVNGQVYKKWHGARLDYQTLENFDLVLEDIKTEISAGS